MISYQVRYPVNCISLLDSYHSFWFRSVSSYSVHVYTIYHHLRKIQTTQVDSLGSYNWRFYSFTLPNYLVSLRCFSYSWSISPISEYILIIFFTIVSYRFLSVNWFHMVSHVFYLSIFQSKNPPSLTFIANEGGCIFLTSLQAGCQWRFNLLT